MDLRGRRVLVVGLAASGRAAVRLLLREGARVAATDVQTAAAMGRLPDYFAGVELHLGGHPEDIFTAVDLIVVSPGVPPSLPGLAAAGAQGVPVIGEMGLAAAFVRQPLAAVSGTNGKSTTTALIAHLLEAAGRLVFLGGNIGRPLTELVLDEPEAELGVVEVSSFQLESMPFFKPRVAALTNLSPDHLDRHGSFEAYARLKARLWADLGPEDHLILNASDQAAPSLAASCQARKYAFGAAPAEVPGAHLTGPARALLLDHAGRRAELDLSGWPLPGGHNLENLLAGLLAAWLMSAPPEALERGLASFKALPHRLQWLRTLDGVDYYNDSKATNVDSAARAVAGFDRPIILIAGGLDKGGGYAELAEVSRGRLKAAVLIGQAAPLIAPVLAPLAPVHQARVLDRAVALSRELARPGDVVLLAPACASYDQFKNYVQRGETFARLVGEMK